MADDDRVAVKTYVPRHQKEVWQAQADELEMSQSEFVRTMVQAGRTNFEIPAIDSTAETTASPGTEANDDFADRILEVLQRTDALGWDGLVDALVDDVEAELDDELQRLQDENRVRYSGREGGYVVTNDE
ncbi:DUF5805 domain-containing protein [Natronorubrum halophilum]|uniref:DUF5805 domain-containing protein n=1 Tax=Natronorubrum halophilum TaxID=1702106 RepID=UPI000EF6D6CE|nr:DUF5805 domain-containing protein [Natronorubrum halophilum]